MKNKKIVFILVIIVVISIIGFSFHILNDPFASCKNSIKERIFSDCASCVSSCYTKIAFEKKDLDICQNIKNKELKNACIIGTAAGKKDPNICQNMVMVSGLISNDVNKLIDSCLINVAITIKDSSICDMIKTESWKNECYRHSKQE